MVCFRESSQVFECDHNEEIGDTVVDFDSLEIAPGTEGLLSSAAYLMPLKESGKSCYISSTMITRLDGLTAPYMSSNTKRIIIADVGLPPKLDVIPPEQIQFHIGEDFYIPISDYSDPEGQIV